MADEDYNNDDYNEQESKDQDGEAASGEKKSRYDAKTEAYLQALLKEKHVLSTTSHPIASRLMDEEVTKTQQSGRATKDFRYIDVFREKQIKVSCKVIVPVRSFPKFNFVGKLLGPKGNTLRRLQEETMCKMSILGRGSMKDKAKEEDLRKSLDPKYSHLSDDLHVEITAIAPPAEAHARIAYALAEIRKYLIPDANDEISFEQLREMEKYVSGDDGYDDQGPPHKKAMMSRPTRGGFRGSVRPPAGRGHARTVPPGQRQLDYDSHRGYDYDRPGLLPRPDFDMEDDDPYDNMRSRPEPTRGRWNSGYNTGGASATSRFVPRSAPYNRPLRK